MTNRLLALEFSLANRRCKAVASGSLRSLGTSGSLGTFTAFGTFRSLRTPGSFALALLFARFAATGDESRGVNGVGSEFFDDADFAHNLILYSVFG